MSSFNAADFRQQFPLIQTLDDQESFIYFDNAATTQKFSSVIKRELDYYQQQNANVHRGAHRLSALATQEYENARHQVKAFINAEHSFEIIWTKGTTEAINLVANTLGEQLIQAGDELVISMAEHHANIVCWQQLAIRKNAKLVVLPLTPEGLIDINQARQLITAKCRLVAVHHISNVVGKVNDIKSLIHIAHQQGAKILIDGAQAIAHVNVDVQQLDCDFYVFSGHKIFAPTGTGVLYGKKALLDTMPPYQFGGEMIKTVSFEHTTFNTLPFKFEAGTPNIAGVIGFAAALRAVAQSGDYRAYEQQLADYLYAQLSSFSDIAPLFSGRPDIPLVSFTVKNHHHQDVASYLDSQGIAVRAGHHCAMPLLASKGVSGSLRVSLAPYNNIAEIDRLISVLRQFFKAASTSQESQPSVNSMSNSDANIGLTTTQVVQLFANAQGWDKKHRVIMLLSKQLSRADKADRDDAHLIQGCESKAWLYGNVVDGALYFSGDSDARLIRGLMVIIFSLFQGKDAQTIINTDVDQFFAELGLMQHLSPSRGNGVNAIVARIKAMAVEQQAHQ